MERCKKPVAETGQLVTQEMEHFQVHSHSRQAKHYARGRISMKCFVI